jgi:hypothetical protein
VLLEILMFSYGVDPFILEAALGKIPPSVQRASHPDGRLSLLTHTEIVDACHLGTAIAKASARSEYDDMTDAECHLIFTKVIWPAQTIKIYPEYMLEKMVEFRDHKCTPGREKESMLYARAPSLAIFGLEWKSTRWMSEKRKMHMANCLVSDGIVLKRIELLPDEAKCLIEDAIASFTKKHCKMDKRKLPTIAVSKPATARVSAEVWAWVETVQAQSLEAMRGAIRIDSPVELQAGPLPQTGPLSRVDEEVEPPELPNQGRRMDGGMRPGYSTLPARAQSTFGDYNYDRDAQLYRAHSSAGSYPAMNGCSPDDSTPPRSQSAQGDRVNRNGSPYPLSNGNYKTSYAVVNGCSSDDSAPPRSQSAQGDRVNENGSPHSLTNDHYNTWR